MNKKYAAIAICIVVLITAGIYYVRDRLTPRSSTKISNFNECIRAGYPALESYPAQCRTPDGKHFVEDVNPNPFPASGPLTIAGETACLPKIGQDTQTTECAVGLMGADGRFYGLKNLSLVDPEYKYSVSGVQVEVSGTFSRQEMKGPDGNRYDVVGVLDVASIRTMGN